MAMLSYQISSLLEKMSSPDKDYRFMATNDLMTELQKDNITLDDDTERKVVKMILRLLEDKNGEVQNLAVRCLAPLVHKIKIQQLETIIDMLCSNMEAQNDQLRDVSSIALKTVMAELSCSVSQASMLCTKRVLPRLTDGLCSDNRTDVSVKLEILDILCNLILRFGRTYSLNFEEIDRAIFIQLKKERQALRKRSIHTLGYLVEVVSNEQYDRIVKKVLQGCIDNAKNINNLRTYVSATNSICRSSSARFSAFLPEFVPLFIQYCTLTDDDELKEACLQAFETFTYRCSKEILPYLSSINNIITDFIAYDPNYQYDECDDAENFDFNGNSMETDDKSSDDGDISDQDEYSDDEDLSWKVRRASAKYIETLITFHPDKLYENYINFGPLLIKRFKEREDNVKYDIFQAYSALLKRTTRFYPDVYTNNNKNNMSLNINTDIVSVEIFETILQEELGPEQLKIIDVLRKQTPSLIKMIYAQIKSKNLKTRHHCFILLSNLLKSLPNALSDYFHYFIGPVQTTLNDKVADGNIKINALHFIMVALSSHHSEILCSFFGLLTPLVVNAVQDPFYKISSEALVVAQQLIRILRSAFISNEHSEYVAQIYTAIVSKLKITDIDQEVKEKTISAVGLIVSVFANEKSVKLDECLPLLLDRLRNEMTRCITVKTFTAIVTSPLKIDLSPFLSDLLFCLADFLRKNQRTLRILTLILLESLVIRYAQGGLENCGLLRVVREISSLINEQDLQISLLSIKFITDVISAYPDQISDSLSDIFLALVNLTQSSLLHGVTLSAALNLFVAIVKSPLPNKPTFEESLDRLSLAAYDCKNHILHRQAYIGMAKAIASVTKAFYDLEKANKLIVKLNSFLQSDSAKTVENDSIKLFAILTMGEVGRIYYEAFINTNIEPENIIMESFNSHSEDVKAAASYALGSLAVGNLEKFLPFLLQEISQSPKRQYQLLHALKEIISSENIEKSSTDKSLSYAIFKDNISEIWRVLVQHCDCAEEGIRNIVAECLGKLCLIDAENLLQHLLKIVDNESARVRRTAVNAARFMIVDHPLSIDELLRPVMSQFLKTIQDPDLQVRRAAIVTLNSAAHNKPKLIRDSLSSLLPHLYAETIVKRELVYEVEMGPFKHVVDSGLDLRKAAFECMYTLAEQFLDKIDIFEYMNHVENGLKDQHDIKLLTFLMLIRLAIKCPLQVIQRIDRLCELIKPQLLLRPKPNAVKQENEKQDELKRAAIRACAALKQISNHDGSQKMNDLFEIIRSNAELAKMEQDLSLQCFDYLLDSTD